MYKILGGDGNEYGPVSADTLRQWVREGRANALTQVKLEGAANWQALGSIPELADVFSAAPSVAPPTFSATTPPSNQAAAQMVIGPAIGLIVTAALGLLAQLVSLALNLLGAGLGMAGAAAQGQQAMPAWVNALSGGVGIVFNIIGIGMSVVIFFGAMKMKNLVSYNFVMTATILAMVPCISPCCLAGLPVGIWALVMLLKPEVKGAFQSKS